MGYTHYYHGTGETKFHPEAKKIIKKLVDKGFKDKLIARSFNIPLQAPILTDSVVVFNGIGEDGHETFEFNISAIDFDFCKTAAKPYDEIVTKVLLTIKHFHPNIKLSSDGDMDGADWGVANRWAKGEFKKLTKNNMSDQNMQNMVNEAIMVKGKIKRIEKEVLSDLKDLLKKLSGNILEGLENSKSDGVGGIGGHIVLVSRKGAIKLNVDQLMEDLGVNDLEKYEKRGKTAKFLKFNLDK